MPAEPQYPWFLTGDGAFAQLKWKRPGFFSKQGLPETMIRIIPTPYFLHKYGISQYELKADEDAVGVLEKRFPDIMLKVLSDDPVTGVTLLYCDWYGRPTPIMELAIMENCKKCNIIRPGKDTIGLRIQREKTLLRENFTLKAQVAKLQKDLHNLILHTQKYDKLQTDRYGKIFQMRGHIEQPGENE